MFGVDHDRFLSGNEGAERYFERYFVEAGRPVRYGVRGEADRHFELAGEAVRDHEGAILQSQIFEFRRSRFLSAGDIPAGSKQREEGCGDTNSRHWQLPWKSFHGLMPVAA